MIEFTEEEFKEVKEKGEELYKSFSDVYCPFFKEKIAFNARGFEHLKFLRAEKTRLEKDQYMRFKLIHLAPEIIKLSHTIQGMLRINKFERVRSHNRTDTVLKSVIYYEFIALIKRDRVKVIIKQIENGEKFFWSIIPYWGMDENTKSRLFYDGTPEED